VDDELYALALEGGAQLATAPDEWLPRLEARRAELAGAIASLADAGDPRGAEMAAAAWRLWWLGGHLDDGRRLLERVVDADLPTTPGVRYALLSGLGTIAFRQGDNDDAERVFAAALDSADEDAQRVSALCDLSRVALRRGDFARVREHARRAYELADAVPGDAGLSARRIPAHMLAAAARMEGDYVEARRYYEESRGISRELGRESAVAGEHHNLGYVDLHSGDLDGARRNFRTALEWVARTRELYLLPYCLVDSAVLAFHDGEPERAATLLGAARAIFDSTGAVPDPDDRVEIDRLGARLQGQAEAEARGRALDVDAALELALG
jgi:tetratricopeptide (TPR) repeat protein